MKQKTIIALLIIIAGCGIPYLLSPQMDSQPSASFMIPSHAVDPPFIVNSPYEDQIIATSNVLCNVRQGDTASISAIYLEISNLTWTDPTVFSLIKSGLDWTLSVNIQNYFAGEYSMRFYTTAGDIYSISITAHFRIVHTYNVPLEGIIYQKNNITTDSFVYANCTAIHNPAYQNLDLLLNLPDSFNDAYDYEIIRDKDKDGIFSNYYYPKIQTQSKTTQWSFDYYEPFDLVYFKIETPKILQPIESEMLINQDTQLGRYQMDFGVFSPHDFTNIQVKLRPFEDLSGEWTWELYLRSGNQYIPLNLEEYQFKVKVEYFQADISFVVAQMKTSDTFRYRIIGYGIPVEKFSVEPFLYALIPAFVAMIGALIRYGMKIAEAVTEDEEKKAKRKMWIYSVIFGIVGYVIGAIGFYFYLK